MNGATAFTAKGMRVSVGWGIVVCSVGPPARADLPTVNAIARLQLVVQRCGCNLRARGAGAELRALWLWIGLGDVPPLAFVGPVTDDFRRARPSTPLRCQPQQDGGTT